MGQPAEVSDVDRLATQALARDIVRSVEEDAAMPLPLMAWPEPFQAVLDGRKRYEVRRDDRGFAVGDTLHLREWDPTPCLPQYSFSSDSGYTGRACTVRVLYMTPGGAWGLPAGLCVMSIELVQP